MERSVRLSNLECIDRVFSLLEGDITSESDEFRAIFWERFFDYFAKLSRTEQNRILTQLADLRRVCCNA